MYQIMWQPVGSALNVFKARDNMAVLNVRLSQKKLLLVNSPFKKVIVSCLERCQDRYSLVGHCVTETWILGLKSTF